jgi:hypothetical protein
MVQFLSLLVFSTFNGFVAIVKNGLTLSWVILHVPITSTTHGRDRQVHDLDVIFKNNVVELSDFQYDDLTFIPPCKKQMNERKSKKKVL